MKWFVMALSLSLTGCSIFFDNQHVEWQTVQPEIYPVLTAIGYAPVNSQPGSSKDHKIILALRASKLDAYRELAEQVYGQQINSSTQLEDMIQRDEQLKASVAGLIRGAKVKESYPLGDLYVTELELDMKTVYQIYMSTAMPKQIKKIRYY